MDPLKHWTAKSINAFMCRIASDFVAQIENKLEELPGDHKELARRLDVSPGRVSQVLNEPGNLTLRNVVRYAQALGMKVAVVAYADGDQANRQGPVNSEIFHACWKHLGSPRNFFELSRVITPIQDQTVLQEVAATGTVSEAMSLRLKQSATTRPRI